MKKEIKIADSKLKQYSVDKPAEMVAMASVLKNHIIKHKLYTNITNRNYVHVEGWQFAGFLLGLRAVVESEENLSTNTEKKWKVTAIVYKGDQVISRGVALCSNAENKKKAFDEYAVLSMAQTRAIGKAYRNLIGWVMKLAGYEGTPSEEMKKVGETMSDPTVEPIVSGVPTSSKFIRCQKCAKPVSEAEATYSQRVYKKILCRDDQPKRK